jgi:hypothetical protein
MSKALAGFLLRDLAKIGPAVPPEDAELAAATYLGRKQRLAAFRDVELEYLTTVVEPASAETWISCAGSQEG